MCRCGNTKDQICCPTPAIKTRQGVFGIFQFLMCFFMQKVKLFNITLLFILNLENVMCTNKVSENPLMETKMKEGS